MKENFGNIFQNILDRVRKSDRAVWFIIAVLASISLLLIYSTTNVLGNPEKNLMKQIGVFFVALCVIIFMHYVHYNHIRKLAKYAFHIILLLLIALSVFGLTINGAKRWLPVPIIGGTLQPSEFIKILLVLYVARTLAIFQTKKGCEDVAFWRILIVSAVVCLWIAVSNFSSAALMALTVLIMLMVGRIRRKLIFVTLGVATFFIGIVVLVAIGTDFRPNVGRVTTGLNRIERFVAPDRAEKREDANFAMLKTQAERDKALYNKRRRVEEKAQVEAAKAAIATGGLLGKGSGNSEVRYVLPLPYSDYVFAILVEEYGLLLGFFIVFLYTALVFKASSIVKRSTRTFPAFLVIGLTTVIVVQAFMNIAVAVNLIPVTGQSLPFVSKGGSSIIAMSLAFGTILSVTYWYKEVEEKSNRKV